MTVHGGSAGFADKNVGTGKAVTVTGLTLGGADAGNYTLVSPTGLTANITPASLAVGGLSANHKVYDATTTASVSGTPQVTPLRADDVAVAGTAAGSFSSKDVGTGISVSVSGLSLAGADAGNYAIVLPGTLSAAITPASLLYVADPKIFSSGGPLPVLTGSVVGWVGGESLATATQGQLQFGTLAVNTAAQGRYAITGSGLTARNYALAQAPGNATALTVNPPEVQAVLPQAPKAALPEAPAAQGALLLPQASAAPALIVIEPPAASGAGGSAGRTGAGVVVTLAPAVGGNQGPSVAVSVPAEWVRSGGGFSFAIPEPVMQELRASGTPARITLASGEALPAWLAVDVQTGRFSASQVPKGGLPLRVLVQAAGFTTALEIGLLGE